MKNLKHSIEIAWDDQKLIKTPEILESIDASPNPIPVFQIK